IGKSRIMAEYASLTAEDRPITLKFQCAAFFSDTTFHPFRRHLEQSAGIEPQDEVEARLAKLSSMTERTGADDAALSAGLFASVLNLPVDSFDMPTMSPGLQKQRTIEALIAQVSALAETRHVQILFEDSHWIDGTSLDAVKALIERIGDVRAHFIITNRPEFEPPWDASEAIDFIDLERLPPADVARIIAQTEGLADLPDDLRRRLSDRTDGIPLFAQELARAFAEGRAAGQGDNQASVPSSLQDSLMARLDRLGSAREAAQFASVIGRDFDVHMLKTISGWPENVVRKTIEQLADSDLITQEGLLGGGDNWTFRHALIHDAAYDSVLRRRRQELHEAVAQEISENQPDRAAREPELVGLHYAAAGRSLDAAKNYLSAGKIAWGKAAAREATAHLDRGIEQVALVEDAALADPVELQLQSTLGVVHFAATSYASEQAAMALTRARELAERVGNPDLQVAVLYGIGAFETMKGDIHSGHQTIVHLNNVADDIGNPRYDIYASSVLAWSYYNRGNYRSAVEYGERVIDMFDQGMFSGDGPRLGAAHPRAISDAFMAAGLWTLGYPSKGRRVADQILSYCESLNDPYSLAYALTNSAIRVPDMMEDWDAVMDRADRGIALANELGYYFLSAYAAFWRTRALRVRGETAEAAAITEKSLASFGALGVNYHQALFSVTHAQNLQSDGRGEEALVILEGLNEMVEASGEFSQETEVSIITGDILRTEGMDDRARKSYEFAIRNAKAREEPSWTLRTRLRLAEMGGDEALEELAQAVEAYPEQEAFGDLEAARLLIAEEAA
ncbi:MAG: hypothetical protein AAF401_09820, partial [Pseudomonadota bacterium]